MGKTVTDSELLNKWRKKLIIIKKKWTELQEQEQKVQNWTQNMTIYYNTKRLLYQTGHAEDF